MTVLGVALALFFGGFAITLLGFHWSTTWVKLAGTVAILIGFVGFLEVFTVPPPPPQPVEDRVDSLVAALRESTTLIGEIENEIAARSELARRLTADIHRHRELLKLNREEVEAVAQTLRVEVRAEGRRGFRLNILVGAIFFVLGVVVTLALR